MQKSETNNLKVGLMNSANLDEFLSENEENFKNEDIPNLLNDLLNEKDINKATLAKRSGISEVYLHQIFAGKRNPSRNRLISLCFGLEASLDQTQDILKYGGCAQLYPKNRRDAIIIYGISHNVPLFEINDKLFTEDEEPLF